MIITKQTVKVPMTLSFSTFSGVSGVHRGLGLGRVGFNVSGVHRVTPSVHSEGVLGVSEVCGVSPCVGR